MPGSTENAMPGASGRSLPATMWGSSCTDSPIPWPVRCTKYSASPARRAISRAAASTCSAVTLAAPRRPRRPARAAPGRTARRSRRSAHQAVGCGWSRSCTWLRPALPMSTTTMSPGLQHPVERLVVRVGAVRPGTDDHERRPNAPQPQPASVISAATSASVRPGLRTRTRACTRSIAALAALSASISAGPDHRSSL